MELKGTVKLKKVTPDNAIYGMTVPGAGHMTLYVPAKPGQVFGAEGTVTVDIPDPPKPKADEVPKKKK